MAYILAIVNQKGGVGKTTSAVNIAYFLAQKGKKTLLLDLDPQGNSTSSLGIEKEENENTTYNVIIGGKDITSSIQESGRKNLDLLASTIDLAGAEVELIRFNDDKSFRLKKALDEVNELYDYVIIDCPPSLGLLTLNGLVASNALIIPTQTEYFAMEGLSQLLKTFELVQKNFNQKLKIFGILLTMYDNRTSLARQVENEVRAHFKELVFTTVIPRNVRLSEAPSHGKTIGEYDKHSKGSDAYFRIAGEIVNRSKKWKKENKWAA